MSLYINACNLFITSLQQLPDPALQAIYQQELNCQISQVKMVTPSNLQTIPVDKINSFFPHEIHWWPLYTVNDTESKSFKSMISSGIKPGIILSDEHLSLKQYQKAKYAVLQGAIPVLEYDPNHAEYFNTKAMFYTALGLRPLAAYISSGWDSNILSHPQGTYIIKNNEYNNFPLPAREIHFKNHNFYAAQTGSQLPAGIQIIVNPIDDIPLQNITYPQFGIAWTFYGIDFESTKSGVKTSLLGHMLILVSLLSIPIEMIISSQFPNILTSLGTSISWISLILGIALLLILIISIIRRVKKDDIH